ncbi:hypothetical protein LINGRAHAP2_LOCUS13583 [Linum grandiflorum]
MKILFWNCRDLGQDQAITVLGYLINEHRSRIPFLLETLASGPDGSYSYSHQN